MKIPKQAKLVFKGKIFEVHQWKERMFNGSYEVFEALKRPDTVQIICTQGSKILIAYEEQPTKLPFYGFFGGRVEKSENPLAAAKRELLEETGMESSDWELLKVFEPISKMEWDIYFYIARNCKVIASPKLDSGERIEIQKLNFESFLKLIDSDKFRSRDIASDILRMCCNKAKLKAFKNKLFK